MIKEALVLQKFAVCFTFTLNDSKSFVVLLLCLLFVPSSLSISFPPSSSFPHLLLVIVRSPYMPFFVFSLFVVFVSCFLCLLCVFSSSTYLFFVSLAFLVFFVLFVFSQDRQDHSIIHIVFFPDKNIQMYQKVGIARPSVQHH